MTDWTSRTSSADNLWNSVTYGNGLFVAVSASGIDNRVMTSPDGITWTSRTSAADNSWLSVTYVNGLFVAVSSSGIGDRVMTSQNGTDWTSRTSSADNSWRSVTYGNGLFVAVSSTGTGNRVMTGVDNSCYLKGTLILTSNDEYIKIENLNKGELIKTYKNENKKILYIGKKNFCNSTLNILFALYKNKENNLIVSGGHSILVDNLTVEQEEQQNNIFFNKKLEDKYLLLCCYSDLFEKMEIDNKNYEIYHLCLENENEDDFYGIWANNMLSETCSIKHFKHSNFE